MLFGIFTTIKFLEGKILTGKLSWNLTNHVSYQVIGQKLKATRFLAIKIPYRMHNSLKQWVDSIEQCSDV